MIAHDTNERGYAAPAIAAAIAALAILVAIVSARRERESRAFIATSLAAAATIVTLFVSLFPRVMVSVPTFANSLTVDNASSAHYTLQVITIATAVLLPIIVLYQSWTYRVFRARIEGKDPGSPLDALGPKKTGDVPLP